MATTGYRLTAKTVLSTLIAAGAILSLAPLAGADEPEQPGGQGQEACAGGGQDQTPEQLQQQQLACGAGIANRAANEAKKAAEQANRAATEANQNAPAGDRPPEDLITNVRCFMHNGVPTLGEVGVGYDSRGPFVHPDEGKPCWYVYGVTATHG